MSVSLPVPVSELVGAVSEPVGAVSELVELEFYVKDTGIGIPKDKQDAIFERFIQADIEDRKARQGTGLGLAISKSYVNMLGGEIWVESEDGVGSTFYFTLPRNAKTEENTVFENVATTVEADNPVKNLKILIVEDDKVSEMLLTLFIDTFSKDILKARTGLDAVETCRNNPEIDLILMDIQMPDMNGYEATRKIREFNKDVIIIAQTSYGLAGDSKKATDAGCNDYILKPIKKADFLSMIKKYFTI
jgi:CheY-like chemotaxis protein